MWGSPCSGPVSAALRYRRSIPCSPCCSYARATLPPSAISTAGGKETFNKKNIRKYKAKIAPISIKKFSGANLNEATSLYKSTYAGSEGGYVTRRCDPRCRAKKTRPATASYISRQPSKDLSGSRYNADRSIYCGIVGIYKSDATTTTDIKMNATTSTNNLDFFCSMQKAGSESMQDDICYNHQYTEAIQQQYNLALRQQWLHNCFCWQLLAQQNPFGYNNFCPFQAPQVTAPQHLLQADTQSPQRGFPQSVAESQNSFQQSIRPCSSRVSRSFFSPSNQTVSPCQRLYLSWPGVCFPSSAYIPSGTKSTCKRCETCGRISTK